MILVWKVLATIFFTSFINDCKILNVSYRVVLSNQNMHPSLSFNLKVFEQINVSLRFKPYNLQPPVAVIVLRFRMMLSLCGVHGCHFPLCRSLHESVWTW